jgi:hypothetical protein
MDRIEIRQVITQFEKITIYDVFDSRKNEIERKLREWQHGKYEDNKLVFYFQCPVSKEELQSLNYVNKIYYYPDENKFEVMIKDKIFKTIISDQYSITY